MLNRRLIILITVLVVCGCSRNTEQSTNLAIVIQASDKPEVAAAKRECAHLVTEDDKIDASYIGITNYQACLGDHANLTHPANRKLCDFAGSTMSAAGTCVLGE